MTTSDKATILPSCFTLAIFARDASSAKELAEYQNLSYKAELIEESEFNSECD